MSWALLNSVGAKGVETSSRVLTEAIKSNGSTTMSMSCSLRSGLWAVVSVPFVEASGFAFEFLIGESLSESRAAYKLILDLGAASLITLDGGNM